MLINYYYLLVIFKRLIEVRFLRSGATTKGVGNRCRLPDRVVCLEVMSDRRNSLRCGPTRTWSADEKG